MILDFRITQRKMLFSTLMFIGLFFNSLQAQQPDKLPVYPGCETAEEKMSCMRENVLAFIGDEFNTGLIKEINEKGQISMYVVFVIDELGKIDEISVKSAYEKLNAEMERVVKKLPLIKPAEADGYPIRMRYELPVVFEHK